MNKILVATILLTTLSCTQVNKHYLADEVYYRCLEFSSPTLDTVSHFIDSNLTVNPTTKVHFEKGRILSGNHYLEADEYHFTDQNHLEIRKGDAVSVWHIPTHWTDYDNAILLSRSNLYGYTIILIHESQMGRSRQIVESYISAFNVKRKSPFLTPTSSEKKSR